MLSQPLIRFNAALNAFNQRFPRNSWTVDFTNGLVADFSFFSSKIEDQYLEYGDTIRFLNGELVRKENLASLLSVNDHKEVLEDFLIRYDTFILTEDQIKDIHKSLMQNGWSWDGNYKPELVGNYRNYPVVGYRGSETPPKEYVAHYNLEISMASYLDIFVNKFNTIDNTDSQHHLITALAYFHNIFLNKIHPFADGNGRVCRIIMGIIMMKNSCPPIFTRVINHDDMKDYIDIIIACENQDSDIPLIDFLASGMANYLENRIEGLSIHG